MKRKFFIITMVFLISILSWSQENVTPATQEHIALIEQKLNQLRQTNPSSSRIPFLEGELERIRQIAAGDEQPAKPGVAKRVEPYEVALALGLKAGQKTITLTILDNVIMSKGDEIYIERYKTWIPRRAAGLEVKEHPLIGQIVATHRETLFGGPIHRVETVKRFFSNGIIETIGGKYNIPALRLPTQWEEPKKDNSLAGQKINMRIRPSQFDRFQRKVGIVTAEFASGWVWVKPDIDLHSSKAFSTEIKSPLKKVLAYRQGGARPEEVKSVFSDGSIETTVEPLTQAFSEEVENTLPSNDILVGPYEGKYTWDEVITTFRDGSLETRNAKVVLPGKYHVKVNNSFEGARVLGLQMKKVYKILNFFSDGSILTTEKKFLLPNQFSKVDLRSPMVGKILKIPLSSKKSIQEKVILAFENGQVLTESGHIETPNQPKSNIQICDEELGSM